MLANSFATLLTLAQTGSHAETEAAAAGAAAVGFGFFCCFGLIGMLIFVFWIWMLIDCCTKTFPGDNDKLIWVLVIILANWVGALVYFFVGRPRGTKT